MKKTAILSIVLIFAFAMSACVPVDPSETEEDIEGTESDVVAESTEEEPADDTEEVDDDTTDDADDTTTTDAPTSFGIFGTDEFDTEVCGYLVTKEQDVFGKMQTNAYFKIDTFEHEGFKTSLDKGITDGNSVNTQDSGEYLFNLGCYEDGKVVGVDYPKEEPYLNQTAQDKLANSSETNTACVTLSFGIHPGYGCTCCNLAHQVR